MFDGNMRGRPKAYGTSMYPVHALQTSNLMKRVEPVLTPQQLKSRFLKGIPLAFSNGDTFSDTELKDQIYLACNEAEMQLKTTLTRELRQEKLPFKNEDYKAYIHLTAEQGPIVNIQQLSIVSADQADIFDIPADWVETSNFTKRIINVVPILAAYGINSVQGSFVSNSGEAGNAGIAFLTILGGLNWIPAYWQIRYESGISNKEGLIPTPVNDLIGCIAAINILSMIAATFITTSQSQSIDGISQSSSFMGPRIYQLRIEELEARRQKLQDQLRGIFSNKFLVGNF